MVTKTKLRWESFEAKFSSWARVIKPGFEQGLLDDVFTHLKSLPKGSVSPGSDDLWRPFQLCPLDELKLVIACDEPYREGADGLALSSRDLYNWNKLPEALDIFYKKVEEKIFGGLCLECIFQNDMSFLAKQGVLLINVAMTRDGENVHRELWHPFMQFLFDKINVPVIFMGKHCREYEEQLAPWVDRYLLDFPSSSSWDDKDAFQQVNKALFAQNGETIQFSELLPF